MTGVQYRVQTAGHRVEKEIARIHPPDRKRIIAAIRQLPEDPRPPGIRQLEPNVFRLRIGDYRIIYKVLDAEKVILVGRVARRSESTYQNSGSCQNETPRAFREPEGSLAISAG